MPGAPKRTKGSGAVTRGAVPPRRRLLGAVGRILLGVAIPIAGIWLYATQPVLLPRYGSPMELVDPYRLQQHVRKLSEELAPRSSDNVENLDRAAEYIAHQFRDAGLASRYQEFQVGERTYRNVLALVGRPGEPRVVVGAHYDAFNGLPGADDNASGVAGLLELGHLLAAHESPPAVELAAYSLEEPPHFSSPNMGSAVHAAALADAGVSVRAMLSLEMIGRFDDRPGSQKFPSLLLRLFYPSRGNFIGVVTRPGGAGLARRVKTAMIAAGGVPVHSLTAPESIPGVDYSDHRSFWAHGVPAAMITDTAFFRMDDYHEPTDTWEKLDYRRMALVVEQVEAAVLALAAP